VCSGTLRAPGALSGTYASGVLVRGNCVINAGPVTVDGKLEIAPGAALLAAYGLNHRTHQGGSSLVVRGNVFVDRGASLVLGCSNVSEVPCLDLPSRTSDLTSSDEISGNLTGDRPLGVIVHQTTIGGGVSQTGGGGGPSCPITGVFKLLPNLVVYSAYEDSTVDRNLTITNVNSCWLGIARVNVHGNLTLTGDRLSNPDATEVLSNHVGGDLVCFHDTHLFDTMDITANLWPRRIRPNSVHGRRKGQCILASPTTRGAKPGPGPF
jgi:hypothetical protein